MLWAHDDPDAANSITAGLGRCRGRGAPVNRPTVRSEVFRRTFLRKMSRLRQEMAPHLPRQPAAACSAVVACFPYRRRLMRGAKRAGLTNVVFDLYSSSQGTTSPCVLACSLAWYQTALQDGVGWRFKPGFALASFDGYEVPPPPLGLVLPLTLSLALSDVMCRFLLIQGIFRWPSRAVYGRTLMMTRRSGGWRPGGLYALLSASGLSHLGLSEVAEVAAHSRGDGQGP
jgi:hypothetical protein